MRMPVLFNPPSERPGAGNSGPTTGRKSTSGQVLVEYLLMVILCISIVLGIQAAFRRSVFGLWVKLTKEVGAACPKGCAPPPGVN